MSNKTTHKRTKIPADVRNRLWIAAAGRCEFKGCCKPVGIDFLTGKKTNVGELAHIVSDSPIGPRGDPARSKELACDEANLMLACFDCHKRIDEVRELEEYPEALLLRWKREHEARVKAIYEADVRTISLPVIMTMPIGAQPPNVSAQQIRTAILKNSDYQVHPAHEPVILDRSDFDFRDDDPEFWQLAERALTRWYEQVLEPKLLADDAAPHVSIAAFAPIPMAMKLGALIGDKRSAMVLDFPAAGWLWRNDEKAKEPANDWFTFQIPETLPTRVFVAVEVSNHSSDYAPVVGEIPVLRFSAREPTRGLIGSALQLEGFRHQFNNFLTGLHRAGVREIDLLPVTSLCTSVEIGRLLLQKIFNRVTVWEFQKETWRQTLDLTTPVKRSGT